MTLATFRSPELLLKVDELVKRRAKYFLRNTGNKLKYKDSTVEVLENRLLSSNAGEFLDFSIYSLLPTFLLFALRPLITVEKWTQLLLIQYREDFNTREWAAGVIANS